MSLIPKRKKFSHRVATLPADGRAEVDGEAGSCDCYLWKEDRWMMGFLTDPTSGRTLQAIRREYIEAMAVDSEEDDQDDDETMTRRAESMGAATDAKGM